MQHFQPAFSLLYNLFSPFTPKISLVILLTVCHTILQILFGKFGVGSTNNLLIDVFLLSHHLLVWYFIGTVRRKSFLVTCVSLRVKHDKHTYELMFVWDCITDLPTDWQTIQMPTSQNLNSRVVWILNIILTGWLFDLLS